MSSGWSDNVGRHGEWLAWLAMGALPQRLRRAEHQLLGEVLAGAAPAIEAAEREADVERWLAALRERAEMLTSAGTGPDEKVRADVELLGEVAAAVAMADLREQLAQASAAMRER